MKIKRYLAVLFAVLIFLSGCAPVQPEADSTPNPTSNTPSEGGGEPTIPPETDPTDPVVPTEPEVVINTEVTPKGSFPESKATPLAIYKMYVNVQFPQSLWTYKDEVLPIEEMDRVYYYSRIPEVLKTYPYRDTYVVVQVTAHPMVFSMGYKPGEPEYKEYLHTTGREIARRMKEAGYIDLVELMGWRERLERKYGNYDFCFVTLMSVEEMKTLTCGDDFSVEIAEWYLPDAL